MNDLLQFDEPNREREARSRVVEFKEAVAVDHNNSSDWHACGTHGRSEFYIDDFP